MSARTLAEVSAVLTRALGFSSDSRGHPDAELVPDRFRPDRHTQQHGAVRQLLPIAEEPAHGAAALVRRGSCSAERPRQSRYRCSTSLRLPTSPARANTRVPYAPMWCCCCFFLAGRPFCFSLIRRMRTIKKPATPVTCDKFLLYPLV